jgi:hypothetical protein
MHSWNRLTPDRLDFRTAAEAIVLAAEQGRAAGYADRLYDSFAWRRIV